MSSYLIGAGQIHHLIGQRGKTPPCPSAKFRRGDVVKVRNTKALMGFPREAVIAVAVPPGFSPDHALADLVGARRPLMAHVGARSVTYILVCENNPKPYLARERDLLPSGKPPVEIGIVRLAPPAPATEPPLAEGLIAPGDVDERSILDVRADDLAGYAQCHFFAGIGGWSYALRLAGWPDGEPVWTGSCPCQPFSCAGQRKGHADERHLWPAFHALISQRQPATVFGEQVASKDGREWLAGVRADLEALGYAIGAADLCAAGAGSPQIRQRLYWMAHRKGIGAWSAQSRNGETQTKFRWQDNSPPHRRFIDSAGNIYRIPEPEVSFVVNGFPGILDQIRAFGNAIVPQVAAEFIAAFEECRP